MATAIVLASAAWSHAQSASAPDSIANPGSATLAQSGGGADAPARKRPRVEIVRAEVGYGGEGLAGAAGGGDRSGERAPGDRYAPVRVWLSSEKGFSGVMVLEHAQDNTQAARVMVPAAATPGVVTPVDAVVCLPRSMPEIKVTLIDGNAGRVLDTTLAEYPDRDQQKLFGAVDSDYAYVMSVGRHSLSTVMQTTAGLSKPRMPGEMVVDDADWWAKLAAAVTAGQDMPRSVGAYEGLEALVIAPETLGPIDPRVVEAVRRWTASGGKLVLVVGTGGSAWRSWLPEGEEFDFVEVGEAAKVKTPPELRTMLGTMRELALRRDPSLVIAEAGEDVSARAIALRARGEREGWRVRWSVGGEKGLLAEGPVGFGFVTIVGVEPERVGVVADPRVTRRLWRDALRGAVETWRRGSFTRTDENYWIYDYQFNASGGDLPTRIGVAAVLDELSRSHTVNPISFLVIAGSMGALGLVLGIGDYLWLGALRKRHLGWATALGWIGVAGVVAAVVPTVIRGGDSAVSRWQVVDARGPRDGAGSAIAADVVASFVQRRAGISLEGLSREGWYRGVSASNGYYVRGGSRGLLLPALELRESPGDPSAGCVALEMEQPQWTFRAMKGIAPAAEPRVALEFEGHVPRVRVEIEEGATIAAGRLEIGAEVYDLMFAREGESWRARSVPGKSLGAFERQALETMRTTGGMMNGQAPAESLGMSMRTELAQEARLASGRWARVHLWIKGLPTGLRTGIEEKGTLTRIVRATLELPESKRREAREVTWTADAAPVEKGRETERQGSKETE